MAVINNMPQLAKFNNATQATDGLMSRNDKQKLDSLHAAKTYKVTLLASGWTANRPYTQTIKVPDMTKDVNGSLLIDPTATEEEINATADASIKIVEQSIGYLTLEVQNKKPTIDIPVVIIFGENLAVLTPPKLVDTSNRSIEININPTDWVYLIDRYTVTLNLPGISESSNGAISLQSGVTEEEAFMVAKARIEICDIQDDVMTLECTGEKPNAVIHALLMYGPSITVIEVAQFGGKVTPEAKYVKYDDSKTGLQATNVQTAIENMTVGSGGLNKKLTHFKTIATLKEAMDLQVGQLVITSGYYIENDGGGAEYIITADNSKEDNGGSVHVLKNKLRAELMLPRGENINLKTFGMYADQFHDDSIAFNRAFDYCKQIKGGTITWQGKCAIANPLIIDSHYINIDAFGSNSVIQAIDELGYCIIIDYGTNTDGLRQIRLKNFRIDAFRKAKTGLLVGNNTTAVTCLFENIYIENAMDYGLILDATQACEFNMVRTYKCHGSVKLLNGAADNVFTNCDFSDAIINHNVVSAKDENYNGYKLNIYNNWPTRNRFINGTIGHSENEGLVKISCGTDIEFTNIMFDLQKTLCDDYCFLIDVDSMFTKFTNCQINGFEKTCGLFKNDGLNTSIIDFKAGDTKADIHVLSSNAMVIRNFIVGGDSTPLVVYSTNADPTVIDIDRAINKVADDRLFPSNANYYNFYMNESDELGVKGKLNNYWIDKRLKDELINQEFVFNNVNTALVQKKLPLEGVWDIVLYMTTDDKNQGSILRYNVAFKQNSVYNVINKQEFTTPIKWGFGLQNAEPTIDELGNFAIEYKDTNGTNRVKWTIVMKAERVLAL